MKCCVRDVVGENAITLEDGQAVFDLIHPELKSGSAVELDFEGVQVFATPFFNAGLGQLLKDSSSDDLNRLVKVSRLNSIGQDLLRRVIENAKRYYSSPTYREAQTKALRALVKDD